MGNCIGHCTKCVMCMVIALQVPEHIEGSPMRKKNTAEETVFYHQMGSHRTQDLCMERTVQDAIEGGRGGARGIHHRDHHAQGTQDTSMMIEWIEKEKIQ